MFGFPGTIGRFVYLLVRTLVARIIGTSRHGHDDSAKDLEILVLRYQLRVLQRGSTLLAATRSRCDGPTVLAVTEREIKMNRGGGVGIIGVIVIVVVILFLVGVIRL